MNEDDIKRHWALSNPTLVKTLKRSAARVVYEVKSLEGRFVFKIADPSKDTDAVAKDMNILRFLGDVGYPAPRILPTSNGEDFIKINENIIYALSLIDGTEPQQTVQNYKLLGIATATLHNLRGYAITTNFTTDNEIPKMLARAKLYNMDPLYEELVRNLPNFSQLPSCVIHTDIGAHNSIQQPDGSIVLIDWDDAGIGTRVLDIGFPLICDFVSSKDLTFDTDRARGFYDSYSSVIKLTDLEKQYLFDAALFYALSYTIFDESGIVDGQWKKVLSALEQKDKILSVLPK